MIIEPHNRFPRYIIRQLRDLSWTNFDTAGEDEKMFAFFTDERDLVGCVDIRFEAFKLFGSQPYYQIYINRFEVVPTHRGEGWGRYMIQWLLNNYPIYRIELCHVDENQDSGRSYHWWRHMGFRRMDVLFNKMSKTYKK